MKYDAAIIGGGLAGLSLSIDLGKKGYSVIVIEKGNYPRHKVCGEYISMESHGYLQKICPDIGMYNLPYINNFKLSSTGKSEFTIRLPLGGFGISRYLLEDLLFKEAQKNGVVFMLDCKAFNMSYDIFEVEYTIKTNREDVYSNLVFNSTGRKSNFRSKFTESSTNSTNYVGVKYHIKLQRDAGFVELHNFPGGYCGLSGIEDNKTCLCYMVNSKKLNSVNNSISELERVYLFQNNHLKKLFKAAEFLYDEPLTISGINFNIKEPVVDNYFYLGDSAGSISPVTGNGMSIALRSASVLGNLVDSYFCNKITKQQLIEDYTSFWKNEFYIRMKLSRHFQKLSEYPLLTNLSIGLFKPFPFIAKGIISQTHGVAF
jgi:flavin-dependent dehydrogenase